MENEQLDNQYYPILQNHRSIPASISTDNVTTVSDITPPSTLNLSSVLSLDLNSFKGASGELGIDYLQMIQKNDQVKDKYKARIYKGKKFQMNFKDALNGSTLKAGDLYIYSIITVL